MQKYLIGLFIVGSIVVSSLAFAGPQQEKMKSCNADAATKALKGDERKAFMKDCLSADKEIVNSQHTKMKTCNQSAGEKMLKGDERKAFMKSCLSS